MANLSKFSAQESLNLETTMNWNPTMINGVKRKDSDTLYFNVYNVGGTARSITYNLS